MGNLRQTDTMGILVLLVLAFMIGFWVYHLHTKPRMAHLTYRFEHHEAVWAYWFIHAQWWINMTEMVATEVIPCGKCERAIRVGERYWHRLDELDELDGPALMFHVNTKDPALCSNCTVLEGRPPQPRSLEQASGWERRFAKAVADRARRSHDVPSGNAVRALALEAATDLEEVKTE